jgi:ABC-type nitrate/sulfonate/bicarbonate transport system permease component
MLWEVLALTVFAGRHVVPTPTSVVAKMFHDHFYSTDIAATLGEAVRGWALGNAIALVLAATCLLAPRVEPFLLSLGVMSYCVPIVAVGPLLVILESPYAAKVGMAALSVFFVTLVAAVTGMRAAPRSTLEVITGFGGGRLMALRKVRLRAAVPSLATGLCISAPAAILGAMIGDYLGGQKGLGVVMLQAETDLAVSRTWAIALVATALSGAAFFAMALLARVASGPPSTTVEVSPQATERPRRPWPVAAALATARIAAGVVVVLAIWSVGIRAGGLNHFFAKSPSNVWQYVVSGPGAALHRAHLWGQLRRSLHDAAYGWLGGMAVAIVAASLLTLSRAVAAAVYPLIVVLRSVPLIAMTPLIALVCGRGILGVTVIAGIVTFVPALVTLAEGLRCAPKAALDVVACNGGSGWTALWKVRAPFAGPSAFAAAKISLPGALLGAILAEFLITGRGLGKTMASDIISSGYSELWSAVCIVVVLSVTLYTVVAAGERLARARLAIG